MAVAAALVAVALALWLCAGSSTSTPVAPPAAPSTTENLGPAQEPADVAAAPPVRQEASAIPKALERRGPPETLNELFESHLKVAPDYLQKAASRTFEQQAQQIEGLIKDHDVDSLPAALTEIENIYAARLRRLAARETAAGRGLLLVNGLDFDARIRGKLHVRWAGADSILGRAVEVLVVLDDGDRELEELDRRYRELRAIRLAEALQHFNNLPYEERLRITDEFRKRLAAGTERDGGRKWFGIDPHELHLVRIDPSTR